ncbi:MAG: hypothetical protein ACOX2O_10100 [Bdellovibrionota bacterium]|jgi:phosphoglycolate phosphatase-like HAD superfamily hydrolase
MSEIIVFDFDGVLLDSRREIIVTGFNLNSDKPVKKLSDVEPSFRSFMEKKISFARNGGETSALASLAHQNPFSEITRSEFDQYVISLQEKGELLKIQKDFFEARRRFLNSDKGAWLALNEPHHPLWKVLCTKMQGEIIILTYKNHDAVTELCNYFGLNVGKVYSIQSGTSKAKALAEIGVEKNASRIHFVDDAYRNLSEIKAELNKEDLNLLWADWGYGFEEKMFNPKVAGILRTSQDELIKLILSIY